MREGKKHRLPLNPETAATLGCALAGNPIRDLSVRRLVLNPLSHTSQGWFGAFLLGGRGDSV